MSDDTTKHDASGGTSRRDVLRTTAAATAAGLGAGALTGVGAAANATIEDAGGADPEAVEASLAGTGSDVLAALSEDGLLADASTDGLPTARQVDVGAVAANREGTAAYRHGGVLRYVTVAHVDGGVVSFTVEPGQDRAYAHFVPADGDGRYLYDPEAGKLGERQDVGAQATCECRPLTCSDGSPVEVCEHCECGTICGDDGCCCTTWTGCC